MRKTKIHKLKNKDLQLQPAKLKEKKNRKKIKIILEWATSQPTILRIVNMV